ncbi:MAG: mevalonate 3,5-bisphosphate decarboxylase [Cuniculiplasma sp.]
MNIDLLKNKGKKIQTLLDENGYFKPISYPEPEPEDGKITHGISYPIKAFEKFLGYYDVKEKIAYNPSISFNTDFSYCLASCQYEKDSSLDRVILDGVKNENYTKKAKTALDIFRKRTGMGGAFNFYIKRYRRYEEAKGMSESSAIAASVSKALINNIYHEKEELMTHMASRYARLVSGSGTRACIQGLSLWLSYPGVDPEQSFAMKIKDNPSKLFYGIFPKKNAIKTDQAHSFVKKSIFYETWLNDKMDSVIKSFKEDFSTEYLIERGERDSLNLHSVLLSSGMLAQTGESIELLRKIVKFKEKNPCLYINADTGPSIMVSSLDKNLVKECIEEIDQDFIWGSFNYDTYGENLNDFKNECTLYYESA